MTPFAHFLRFFALSDSGRPVPGNALTPVEAHPVLPAVPGDCLRFLLPKSDLAGCPANRSEIVLLSTSNVNLGKVGSIRVQDSEQYVQFTLAVDNIPAAGQQFGLMRTQGGSDKTVLGTVRGQFASLDAYIKAIQQKFEAYPHAPVLTIRRNNQLTVRVFRSARFQPSDADLLSWRVGLGFLSADSSNSNSPSLNQQPLGSFVIAATDTYNVFISDDIEAGNVFQLQGISYTATASDTPESVRVALGLGSDYSLTVASGTAVTISSQVGVYRTDNRNRPMLQLLYDSNNGAGSDKYKAVVGLDIQAGNVYQVSASGMTTKTVIATATDTPATIAALFNSSGGFILIPAGQNPTATTDAGSLTVANTNLPVLYLTGKITTPSYTLDRYRVFVGSSIQRGNTFVVEQAGAVTKTVVATASDTPAEIAQRLGYLTNPFTIDVPTGALLSAYARRGARYSEPDDVAPVRLLSKPAFVRPDQVVGEVFISNTVQPGLYALGLRDKRINQVIAQSNRIRVQIVKKNTSLLRWGSIPGTDRIFSYQYAEAGLTQQLRLPVYVGVSRQKTEESQYGTPSGDTIRTDLKISYLHTLTTDMQPAAFHRALLMALKHPRLLIDGKQFRCLSEYSESEPSPVKQLIQAETDLTEIDAAQYRAGAVNELLNLPGAFVDTLVNVEALGGVWLQSSDDLLLVRPAMMLSAAEYDLRVLCPHEAYNLSAYINDRLALNVLLTSSLLSRAGRLRLEPGDRLRIEARNVAASVKTMTPGQSYNLHESPLTSDTEMCRRGSDFNEDFNSDY